MISLFQKHKPRELPAGKRYDALPASLDRRRVLRRATHLSPFTPSFSPPAANSW